jgi:hypothetical protein
MKPRRPLSEHVQLSPAREQQLERVWPAVQARLAGQRRRRLWALGVPALAAVATAWALWGRPAIRTGAGEGAPLMAVEGAKEQRLRDDTRLTLGPGGHAHVVEDGPARARVRLDRGRLVIAPPPEATRLVSVEFADLSAHGRSAQFEVERAATEVQIRVGRGEVALHTLPDQRPLRVLGAGEVWAWSLPLALPRSLTASSPGPAPVAAPVPTAPAPGASSETAPAAEPVTVHAQALAGDDEVWLTRRGSALYWGQDRYRFVGFTAYTLTGCGRPQEVPSPEQTRAFLARLRPRSVVRTFAFEAQGLVAVEHVVRLVREAGHKVVLVLGDHNGSCGDGGARKPREFYEGEYRERYLSWARALTARLAHEPAVAAWELMRAPVGIEPHTLRAFYDEVGKEVRRLAPRHLIASGTHGAWAYGSDGYRLIHESGALDLATFHDYNGAWGAWSGLAHTARALQGLDKPLVAMEIGFFGSPHGDPGRRDAQQPCLAWPARAEALRAKLSASFSLGVAGATLWNWMPVSPGTCRFELYPEDPAAAIVRDLALD